METVAADLEEMARAARILARHGHEDLVFGHLAMRDPAAQGVWMKPAGSGLSELHGAADFILVGWDGERLRGTGRVPAEWAIHVEPMRLRPDIRFSAHTHPTWTMLVAAADFDLWPVTQDAMRALSLGLARYDHSGDLIRGRSEAEAVCAALGEGHAVLLRNHGVAFYAADLPTLTMTGVWIERAATAWIRLAGVGQYDAEAIDRVPAVVAATLNAEFVADCWAYLLRELARAEAVPPAGTPGGAVPGI